MLDRIDEALDSTEYKEYHERYKPLEILQGIKHLPSDRSFGKDEVHNQFLINLPKNKISDILGIHNRSWNQGVFPDEWKTAVIIPIPKPDKNLELPESYRPIALLSCISKLIENMVGRRLVHITENEKMFSVNQYGFRFRRGTVDPIIGLSHKIHTGTKLGKVTIIVFFFMLKVPIIQ